MKVEIWSDVVCPWCYIGKRRFEAALSEFSHRDQVDVVWRSYQLDPDAPRDSDRSVTEVLASKYGVPLSQAEGMNARVSGIAAEDGLDYHLEKAKYSNTFDAHRLLHLAATVDKQGDLKERLMHAYFTEGAPVGDAETLVRLASEAGIDPSTARSVLASDAYAGEVRDDLRRAAQFGIRGVPFFAIDETYGVSGAQPADTLREVLEQAWAESHPLIKVGAGSQDAGLCEGDSCDI